MRVIWLLDTSIFLNVLDVAGWNQDRGRVLQDFQARVEADHHFLLPLATVWETGNHIARLADASLRRQFAQVLADAVTNAVAGKAPFQPTYFPSPEEFLAWVRDFPEFAQRSKSPKKTREGVSLADMSIIKEFERTCALNALARVVIWSLDSDLQGYDRAGRDFRR